MSKNTETPQWVANLWKGFIKDFKDGSFTIADVKTITNTSTTSAQKAVLYGVFIGECEFLRWLGKTRVYHLIKEHGREEKSFKELWEGPEEITILPQGTLQINLSLGREEATALSYALSDILCWARGFMAANTSGQNNPLGLEELRTFNILLKKALSNDPDKN